MDGKRHEKKLSVYNNIVFFAAPEKKDEADDYPLYRPDFYWDHFVGRSTFVSARRFAERAEYRFFECLFYGNDRNLCDRSGGGGHLHALVFVWPVSDPVSDSDGRAGLYDLCNAVVAVCRAYHYHEGKAFNGRIFKSKQDGWNRPA